MATIHQSYSMTEAMLALPFLASLDAYYPDFQYWFVNQVVPGVVTGKDVLLLAKQGEHVVGVALGKVGEETKLRCIRVHPNYQQHGLGIRLIDRALETMACEKPHVTVAEELLHQYSRAFVTRYGFELSDVRKGMYRRGKLEYLFN